MGEIELIHRVAAATRTAVITGPAAAKLRGLQTLDRVTSVDLLLPGTAHARRSTIPGAVYRSGRLDPCHVVELGGRRVTSTIQMSFDTCRYHGPLAALVVLESARFGNPLTDAGLKEQAGTLPRAAGLALFRRVIDYSCATSQSALETVARHAIIEARIPGLSSLRGQAPFTYHEVTGHPRTGRMDLLLNGFLCVELDGRSKYSDASVTFDERIREKQLLNLGYVVLRAGWPEVLSGALVQRVANAIRRYRHLREDPHAGNIPRPLGDGELTRLSEIRRQRY